MHVKFLLYHNICTRECYKKYSIKVYLSNNYLLLSFRLVSLIGEEIPHHDPHNITRQLHQDFDILDCSVLYLILTINLAYEILNKDIIRTK